MTQIYFEVNHPITRNLYSRYVISRSSHLQGDITGPWNARHTDLDIFLMSVIGSDRTNYQGMTFLHLLVFKIFDNHWTMKYKSHWPRYILSSIIGSDCNFFLCVCWGLTTRQPLWVILCRLPEKGRKEIEEIVEEMKERNREERGTGMKEKKQKK